MTWPMVKLGDVVSVKGGGTPSKDIPEYWNGGISWASVKDFKSTTIKRTTDFISEEGLKNSATNLIPAGNVLVPTRMAVGKVAINEIDLAINQDIKALFPSPLLNTRYLLHTLLASERSLSDQATGATVKGIKLDVLQNLEIPLPPLEEQKRIAAILDNADQLRQKRRQATALLDSLTQSIFVEMFGDPVSNPKGWKTAQLSDVSDFFAGNSLPSGVEFEGQVSGYLLLKVSDLNRPGNISHVNSAALFSEKPGARAGTAPTGTIVFPKRGGAIATNKKRTLARPAILDPNLMGVAPKPNDMTSEFLAAWFRFLDLASISSGSSVPQLNKQDLAPLVIHVPPLQRQREYGTYIAGLSAVSGDAEKSVNKIEQLFTSLQHRAFAGEL